MFDNMQVSSLLRFRAIELEHRAVTEARSSPLFVAAFDRAVQTRRSLYREAIRNGQSVPSYDQFRPVFEVSEVEGKIIRKAIPSEESHQVMLAGCIVLAKPGHTN